MKKSYTFNELINAVNGDKWEEDPNEKDVSCQTDHRKTSKKELLDLNMSISPDNRIISNILNYSRALSMVNTKNSGNFSLMMN
jgi:hypothetical protein